MNNQKNGNLVKLVAFFLIAIILTVIIAFSASGWYESDTNLPENDEEIEGEETLPPKNPDVDENKDGLTPDTPVVETPPEEQTKLFYHFLNGKEISEEETKKRPFACVIDPDAPLYAISSAYTLIEVPLENGKTRYIIITDDATSIGKLGAIAPTRNYINDIIYSFSSIPLYYGKDDSFLYNVLKDSNSCIDLKSQSGFSYLEYNKYCYTNADLVEAYISNNNIELTSRDELTAPYLVSDDLIISGNPASVIDIPYEEGSGSRLIYCEDKKTYELNKNEAPITDLHSGNKLYYDNVLVLGIDATTHETEGATEQILNIKNGGKGYYALGGQILNITWSVDDSGCITVFLNGEKLTISQGSTYISFVKSSMVGQVIIG